jgi:hypothetical protein
LSQIQGMSKRLILSYDYELFLGEQSGKVDDCLIRPTERIISIMEEAGMKSIFFVDSVYLMRLKEQALTVKNCENDYNKIASQLRELIRKGHYVYPHIHPHWLDAVYHAGKNEWQLSRNEKYRFSSLTPAEQRNVFKGSYEVLKEILIAEDPGYEINAHRAGGWSVQPFTNFKPFYEEYKFKYDFSVLSRFYMFTMAQYFDYSCIPDKNIYRFDEDVTREMEHGKFIEFVNSTIIIKPALRFFDRLLIKVLYKVAKDYSYGKGTGQAATRVYDSKPVSDKGYDMTDNSHQYIAIEQLSVIKMKAYLSFFKANDYMHFVSHPKMVTDHNLNTFSRFLKKVQRDYRPETDFKKMF